MRTPLYRRALKSDLDRWISKGLVPQGSREAIMADIDLRRSKLSVVGILAMLGAVFMALAVLTFIGANWGGISKIVRFGLVLGLMWSTLGIAVYALKREATAFAHAFMLIATALFGGGIMLVAQIFNIAAHYPNGIFIWALGALAVALATPSRPVLLLGAGLTALWMQVSYSGPLDGMNPLIWLLAPLLVSLWAGARQLRAIDCAHVIMLTGLVWAIHLLALASEWYGALHEIEAVALYSTLTLGVLLWAGIGRAKSVFGSATAQLWSGIGLLVSAFALQFNFEDFLSNAPSSTLAWLVASAGLILLSLGAVLVSVRTKRYRGGEAIIPVIGAIVLVGIVPLSGQLSVFTAQTLYGAVFFAGAILALLKGAQSGQKMLLWLGGIAFAAEALYVYFETFKDLLSTSLFFLMGGVLMLTMALIAMRFGKKLGKGGEP